MKSEVRLNLSKLKEIQKNLGKKFITKVGVLASKDGRDNGSNASIGYLHEFGSLEGQLPRRSFLRDPLDLKLPEKIESIGQTVFDSVTEDNIENMFEKLGVVAEEIVQEAFDTSGFGLWEPLKKKTIARKKGFDTILVESTQLKNAITSEVVTK